MSTPNDIPRIPAATNIDDALKLCNPEPLSSKDNTLGLFVEMDDARDDDSPFRDSLRRMISTSPAQRILVYGHRGSGKSTEINKLATEIKDRFLVVIVQLKDYLPLAGNVAADVLLAAAIQLVTEATKHQLALNEKSLEPIYQFFEEVTLTKSKGREADLSLNGEANIGSGILGKLAQLLGASIEANVGLKGELKFRSGENETRITRLQKRPSELVDAVNLLITNVERAWQAKPGNQDSHVLFIFEDFDKLTLSDAEMIFIKEGKLLAEIGARAIYTIPVFTRHSSNATYLSTYFNQIIGLPMIKTYTRDRQINTLGRQKLRQLMRARIAKNVMPDDALDALIERTGGVLRHMFDAIQKAGNLNLVFDTGIISKQAIDKALDRMVNDIGLQISFPRDYEHDRDPKPLQLRLVEAAKAQINGEPWSLEPHPLNEYLLMSNALIEYNGEGWLGVHPLAVEYLQKLKRFD